MPNMNRNISKMPTATNSGKVLKGDESNAVEFSVVSTLVDRFVVVFSVVSTLVGRLVVVYIIVGRAFNIIVVSLNNI